MRAVIQRVKHANVQVEGDVVGAIDQGLLVLLGIGKADDASSSEKLINKVLQLRIFSDVAGKMNLSVTDVQGGLLVISQFTLYADARKGNRPSFTDAAPPDAARVIYEDFMKTLTLRYPGKIAAGVFAADMQVTLLNDGPVTIVLDTDIL